MRRWFISAATSALTGIAVGFAPLYGLASEDDYDGLPEGQGREEVFVICSGCHSIKLVAQQGLDREAWEETLVEMVEEQGMPKMDSETYALVLDYLAAHLGIDHRPPR